MNSDFRNLLKLFNAHRVRFLVVGGYAVMKYTEPRYTDVSNWTGDMQRPWRGHHPGKRLARRVASLSTKRPNYGTN